jgi:hypothetical protein
MITIYSQKDKDNNTKMEVELRGLSTDEKPTTIKGAVVDNGSTFIEIDTGKLYMYDLEHQTWEEI